VVKCPSLIATPLKHTIKDVISDLRERFSEKTVKNYLTTLHKMFTDAYEDELLLKIPPFPKLDVPEPEVKWIPKHWQKRIIGAIPERDRPIFQFICAWGCRPGEARALKWDCVDMEKEVITIKRTFSGAGCNYLQEWTKTNRIRYLPFTDELQDVFTSLRSQKLTSIGGFVFLNKNGRPYTADISRIWNEARDTVGCPHKVTLNQGTRHSFATQHMEKLELVSQVLGHSNIQTTRKFYQGLNLDPIKKMIKQDD
jgi:integrase